MKNILISLEELDCSVVIVIFSPSPAHPPFPILSLQCHIMLYYPFFFFNIYFIFGCTGSLLLHTDFL